MGQGNKKRARRIDAEYNKEVVKRAKEQLKRLEEVRREKGGK